MRSSKRAELGAWETRPPSDRTLSDASLTEQIREVWAENRKVYGARRVHAELRLGRGIDVSRKRVERLMRQAGISGLIRRRRRGTTIRVPGLGSPTTSSRCGFRPAAPNVLWCADITYLETWQGRCYLAAVQDLFSRAIVGWQLAEHMRAELVVQALQMAIARRRPRAGLVHHSDQGSQYVSLALGEAAGDAGIAVSMGSGGIASITRSPRASHRNVLQPNEEELDARLPLADAVREDLSLSIGRGIGTQAPECPPTRGHSSLRFEGPSSARRRSCAAIAAGAVLRDRHGRRPPLPGAGVAQEADRGARRDPR